MMIEPVKHFEVNSFWDDGDLSNLEILCISSFLQHGARYNLYTYGQPNGIPPGVTVRDAREVVAKEKLFRYPAGTFNGGSVSGFSNLIRYTLLHRTGGWWVDTDVCCLQPFQTDADELYLREQTRTGKFMVASCVFKAPAAGDVLGDCCRAFEHKDVTKIVHGETGPVLLTQAICHHGREAAVQPGERFMPVPWWEYGRLLSGEHLDLEYSVAVHFWNTMITANSVDKNGRFPPGSVIERLKRRYL